MGFIDRAVARAKKNNQSLEQIEKLAQQKTKAAWALAVIAAGMWHFVQTPVAIFPLSAAVLVGAYAFYVSTVAQRFKEDTLRNRS